MAIPPAAPARLTRRRLLALLPAVGLQLHAQTRIFHRKPKPRAPDAPSTAFFGTDTAKPGAQGIYSARFNPATGQFSTPVLAAACVRPSYLALGRVEHPGVGRKAPPQITRILYAANEGTGPNAQVTAYTIGQRPGADPTLTQLNQVSAAGDGPCYISVDAAGRAAFVANYNGATVATFSIQPDGSLSAPVDRIDFRQKPFGHHGPVAARQEAPHPHSAMLSPDDRFLLVNDLGNDDIVIFPIHFDTARLGTPHVIPSRSPGSGPRHLAFHPNGRWVYGVDELSNRIDQYLWTATHGGLGNDAEALLTDVGHSVSTLDPGFHATNTAAEIALSPAGDFVYVSNRGENSITVFAVAPTDGILTFAQRIACGGRTPRHFTFDPTGRWLICGNQESASVTVFARSDVNGQLTGPVQTLPLESPLFTLFL